jgi:hypothetical protein
VIAKRAMLPEMKATPPLRIVRKISEIADSFAAASPLLKSILFSSISLFTSPVD